MCGRRITLFACIASEKIRFRAASSRLTVEGNAFCSSLRAV